MVGFDAKNKNTINELYLCRICSHILREPFQLDCGHRQCKTCIEAVEGPDIKCAECNEETPRNEVKPDRGCTNDMKSMKIICSLCEWSGLFKDYEEHFDQEHLNLTCEFCQQEFTSIVTLHEHKQNNCTKRNAIGVSTAHSCSDSILDNNSLGDHSNTIQRNTAFNSSDHIEHRTSNTNNERLVETQINRGGVRPILVSTPTNQNNDNQTQEIYEMINTLTDATQTLIETRALIASLITDFSAHRSSNREQNDHINGIQSTSYDGTLTWKITSVREKMADAQSERQTSIYSPPFYSSSTGYKMRARLYLHGDGNARRTHMSLFFVLMCGPNDAILKFPFNYKVTFCLYDQTPAKRHVIDSFRPDIQRPQSEMNIASGIPKFFPLAMIQQEGNPYVRDDVMFIKVMVDFGDMPQTLLPFALSLNPGLPMHNQQALIRQEAERRGQQQQSQQTPTSPENPSTVTTSNVTNDGAESQDSNNYNIASGIPKFVPLAMIQQEGNQYIPDDIIFIQVMVDFVDMRQILLSFALNLNPGLPMHTQQALIRQEAERRAQQQESQHQQSQQQQSQQTPTSSENPSTVTTSNVTNDGTESQDSNNDNIQ